MSKIFDGRVIVFAGGGTFKGVLSKSMIPSRFAPIYRLIVAAASGALLFSPCSSGAKPAGETKSLHEWANLVLTGSGSLGTVVGIPMIFPFSFSTVDLVGLLSNGKTKGTIDVSVRGYVAGTYTVSAVTESSSSTFVLGTLTVTSGSLPILPDPGAIPGSAVASPTFVIAPWAISSGTAEFGGKGAPFPDGFSLFDVGTVSLTDSNSNVVSTATLTPVPSGYYTAVSPLVSGTGSPGASGTALIHAATPPILYPMAMAVSAGSSTVTIGSPLPPIFFQPITGRLVIHGHGLPASTTLTYAAGGTDLGTAMTDASGNLNVSVTQGYHRKLPSTLDLFSVTTVTVHDSLGNILISAGF